MPECLVCNAGALVSSRSRRASLAASAIGDSSSAQTICATVSLIYISKHTQCRPTYVCSLLRNFVLVVTRLVLYEKDALPKE